MKPYRRELRFGDKGDDVAALRERLRELKFDRTFVNGKPDHIEPGRNDFTITVQNCLENFQAKVLDIAMSLAIPAWIRRDHNLLVHGRLDKDWWYVLQEYHNLVKLFDVEAEPETKVIIPDKLSEEKLRLKFLEVLLKEVGVREEKNNGGKRVDEYIKVGSGGAFKTGIPWCYAFINWGIEMACRDLGIKNEWNKDQWYVYTPYGVKYSKDKKVAITKPKLNEVTPGDLFFIYGSSRGNAVHIGGCVLAVNGNKVTTIEGNTNPGGGSEGFGVFKRTRPLSQLWTISQWYKVFNL